MDVIIGSGITGLSYAMFNKEDFLVLEKESKPGGYCKTTQRNGFVWDYSGHFFHFQDENIKKMICKNIDEEKLSKIDKHTRIKYKNRFVDYPFQRNIHQLSKKEMIDCLYDLFNNDVIDFSNFMEMLYCKFGKSISEKFLIPYNTKLYACDLNTLDKDAMGRFFPYAEKEDIIRNFKSQHNHSYNNTFIYPKNGAIEYINAILQHINQENIRYNNCVKKISLKEHLIELESGEIVNYNRLISTMPFPELLSITGIEYEKNIYNWNKVLVFNLGFDKKGQNTIDHWIYFPESKYCFYRVGFYDNILNQDKMSLYVEIGFNKDAIIDNDKCLEQTLIDLKKAGIISKEQNLIDYETILMNPAYVHINTKSIEDIKKKKEMLKQYDVYSIGRYGSWTYCSIEDNIKEAYELSKQLNNEL